MSVMFSVEPDPLSVVWIGSHLQRRWPARTASPPDPLPPTVCNLHSVRSFEAREMLLTLGLLGEDLTGKCDSAEMLGRIDLALSLDEHQLPQWLREWLDELRELAVYAHARGRRVVWH